MGATPKTTGPYGDNRFYARGYAYHGYMDQAHLVEHLTEAADLLALATAIPENETDGCRFAVDWVDMKAIVETYGLLKDLVNALPHVRCWVAGYGWGFDGKKERWSGFYGCKTEKQALALAAAAKEKGAKKNYHRQPDPWTARFTDISVTSLVRPKAKIDDVLRGLYT